MKKNAVALFCGVLFALGLGEGGMTQPHVVIGFLDVFGHWRADLLWVMVGAVGVHAVSYRLIQKRGSPLLDAQFYLPQKNTLDRRLLIGAALFGLGWGWAGYCPGPAWVGLMSFSRSSLVFVLAMLTGMFLARGLPEKKNG